MKNKLILQLALLMGTVQLFGAATGSNELGDITATDTFAIRTLLREFDTVAAASKTTEGDVTARWNADKKTIKDLITAGRFAGAWNINDALQYDPAKHKPGTSYSLLGKAINNDADIVDLATDLYIVRTVYKQPLSNAIITAFLKKEAQNRFPNVNKLKLLLNQRDVATQDGLKETIKKLSVDLGGEEAVKEVYTVDQLKAFLGAGLFTADELQSFENKIKGNPQAIRAFMASLGGTAVAAPSEAPAIAEPSTGPQPESSSGTAEEQAQAQRDKEEREAAEAVARQAEEAEAQEAAKQARLAAQREAERLHAEDEARERAKVAQEEADRREAEHLQQEELEAAEQARQQREIEHLAAEEAIAQQEVETSRLNAEQLKLAAEKAQAEAHAAAQAAALQAAEAERLQQAAEGTSAVGRLFGGTTAEQAQTAQAEATRLQQEAARLAEEAQAANQIHADKERLLRKMQGIKKGGLGKKLLEFQKKRAGQELTQQNLREVWKDLTTGRELTAGEVEQLVTYATDPRHTTDQAVNRLWVLANNLIAANSNAINKAPGVSEETIDQWNEIVARKQQPQQRK